MTNPRLYKHPIITTWLPIAISVLSLFLSVGSFYLSMKAEQSRAENVEVSIHPIYAGYESSIKPSFAGWYSLTTNWKLLLANTSDRTIAVVSYEVGELHEKDHFYRDIEMDQGLVTHEDAPISLPLNLDPGQSIMVKAKIGLMVHHEIYDFVMKELGGKQKFPIETLTHDLLHKRGIDFYQNDLTRNYMHLGYHDKVIPFPGDDPEQQQIVLKVRTARGNVYSSMSSWYERETLLNTPNIGMDRFELEKIRFELARLRVNMPNKGMERDAP